MTHSIGGILKQTVTDSRYPTTSEYEALAKVQRFINGLGNSLEAAKLLKEESSDLVSNSLRELLQSQPNLLEKGGSLSDQTRLSEYISELDKLLRLIQYCVLGSDKNPLEEQLGDLRSKYINMGLSIGLITKAIVLLQRNADQTLEQYSMPSEVREFIRDCFDIILALAG